MKKLLVIIGCILTFFLIYFLQSNFFNWFNIAGVKANLFIIFVVYIGLFIGRGMGLTLGLLFGLFLDLFAGKVIGIYGVGLALVGLLAGYINTKFSKESRITIMLCVSILTVIFEIGIYIANIAIFESILSLDYFIKTLMIETIFNSIILIILYPILKKVGYFVQDIFTNSNVLTRYF